MKPPAEIRESFLPFARPDYVEGMVIGDDLDSLLSAAWLHNRFGWPIRAVYCQYTHLFLAEPAAVFREKLQAGRYMAVDLDLYHASVPSLGHHILNLKSGENLPGHAHSLNPNLLCGLSIERGFSQKYPLATIHFLQWIFEEKSLPEEAAALVWLADSSFINAQRYRENVEKWARERLAFSEFEGRLTWLQSLDFERFLQEKILVRLSSASPLAHPNARSNYRSAHLGLNGFQCQFEHPAAQREAILRVLDFIEKTTGWAAPAWPENWPSTWHGKRQDIPIGQLGEASFADWLEAQEVFSYAFTFRDRLNYTRR